jgi:hypothetical protein
MENPFGTTYFFGKMLVYQFFVFGPYQVLVVLSGEDSARLKGRLAPAGEGMGVIGPKPAERLWVSPKPIPPDVALEAGIRVIRVGAANTLFEASRDNAFRLLERGYFVTEVDFRPLADLRRPHFGRDLTEALLAARPMNEARRGFMGSLAESVSADSLRNAIYFLTYDQAGGKYRSRFAARYDLENQVEPYIWDRFGLCSAPGCDRYATGFRADVPTRYAGEDSLWVDLILTKRGVKTKAHYILCAHYDAIAVREPDWAWQTDAAPGADDNATGVAALLECARLISQLDLDVGVTFVAFSGEELGLQGSRHYCDVLSPEDSVLGVINFDMLGYVSGGKRTELTYDIQSKWLSDLLAETASMLDPSISVKPLDKSGVARSDQASFWRVHIPGVMLSDLTGTDGDPLYPYYHTLADTLGQLDIDQVRDNTRLVVAYLSRFAEVQTDTLCDLELTDGSVEWRWEGRGYAPFIAGDSLTANVRAVNTGGSMRQPEVYGFQIWQGDRWTGRMVYGSTRTIQVPRGGYAEVRASWKTSPDVYGEVPYTVSLHPMTGGVESDITDNVVTTSLDIMSPMVVLRDLHVFPNPVTDSAASRLAFEILMPDNDFAGQLEVSVFDLEGQKVGDALLVRSHIGGKDIAIGKNAIDLDRVLGSAWDLPPGIYVCLAELKLTGVGGSASAKFKFAVAR